MTAPDVPPEVLEMLAGRPAPGRWEAMYPMLTVDEAGFPHVCLLSAAELQASRRHVYAVLASPRTIANARRDGKATLVTFGADTATYLKLSITGTLEDGPLLGITCEVASVKRDSLRIPLRPPQYLVTEALPETEDWARSARVLASIIGTSLGRVRQRWRLLSSASRCVPRSAVTAARCGRCRPTSSARRWSAACWSEPG